MSIEIHLFERYQELNFCSYLSDIFHHDIQINILGILHIVVVEFEATKIKKHLRTVLYKIWLDLELFLGGLISTNKLY